MAGAPTGRGGRADFARSGLLLSLSMLGAPAFALAQPQVQPPASLASPAPPAGAPQPATSQTGAPPAGGVDPELTRPLVPLDQFRLEAQQPAGPAPKAPKQIRYTLTVQGLASVGLQDRFRGLSNLEKGHGRADDTAQIRARADEDSELISRLLKSEGYYDGHADVAITPEPAAGAPVAVSITVTPGRQYDLGEIVVTGPPTRPPGLPRRALTLSTGEPIVASKVVAAEANVTVKLPEEGYPFVKVGQRDITLDPASHTGRYQLPVTPGPRSSFGRFVIAGQPVFKAGHIREIARFKTGELYDSRKVDDLRKALTATQLYGELGVQPVETDRPGPDGTTQADLRIQGTRGQSHVINASAGYDTGLGPSVQASWTALNIWPPEGALTVSGTGGTQQQQLGLSFIRSNFRARDVSLTAAIQASRESINAYDADTGQISFGIARQSTPLWQKVWTWSGTIEGLVTSESAYDIFAAATERKLYKIVALPLSGQYDRSDSLLNPTHGFRLKAQLSPEISIQKVASKYVKGVVEADGYLPVSKALVLAGRVQLGSLLGASWFDLAPTRRFYAGGGSSVGQVRGFAYQSLGPKDPSNNALGGSSLTDFSVETRYRFGNFGVVGFLDGGQVYQSAAPGFTNLRYGVGVGLRYYTSIGPVRIDVATPLSRRPGEGVVGVYVSIGQAF